ncbi:MAG TPA: DUF4010 domain-containing protein [Candidatus Levybacteria bacterium]|nr:DUF4010 domain-containing protein [Candidatus Levybacteria bacterium]
MQENLLLHLSLSLILGAVIGLEREINEKKITGTIKRPSATAGLRSFALVSLLGSFTGILTVAGFVPFALIIAGSALALLIVFYILDTRITQDPGFTTELALLMTFTIGALLTLNIIPIQLILATSVVLILLLSQKQQIKDAVSDVQRREVNAFIGFAVVALVILPFLPNTTYALSDVPFLRELFQTLETDLNGLANVELVNPFNLWLIVALITGIDIAGYVLERTVGAKRGWLLASAIGGFISSTAVTIGLAQQSKESRNTNHLVAAALVSNLTSFFQIGLLIAGINAVFFLELTPILAAIIIAGFAVSFYFLKTNERGKEVTVEKKVQKDEIFNFAPALKFALIYLTISVVTKIALLYFGDSGFLVSSALGALAGLDAVMINTASLAGEQIGATLAAWTFILVNAVNLTGKVVYSFIQGSREFTLKFGLSVGVVICASIVAVLFVG